MNFEALFSTPKKAASVIACLLAIVAAVGIGLAYVMRGNTEPLGEAAAIGAENAQKFACADAGVDPASAQAIHVTYERFEGEFVYSVEFIAENTEYTYKINAVDGSVVRKESRTAAEPDSTVPVSAAITLERAQEIALADAGVGREEAIFSQAEAGTDGGLSVFRFKFYAGNVEYEYEINADTGAVYSKKTVTYIGRDPGAASPAPARTAAPTGRPDPTAEPTQSPATKQPEPTESVLPSPQTADRPGGMYIGRNAAKSAALAHAKVSAGEAHFTQVRMDYEDGTAVYVLNFFTSTQEYEYKINAKTGAVLSREMKERSNKRGREPCANSAHSYCIFRRDMVYFIAIPVIKVNLYLCSIGVDQSIWTQIV